MKKDVTKRSVLSLLLAMSLVMGSACSKSDSDTKETQPKKETKSINYVINTTPKDVTAEDIPAGMDKFSVDDWDLSLCYPKNSQIEYSEGTGIIIRMDEESGKKIVIEKKNGESQEPEKTLKSAEKLLENEIGKLSKSEVMQTKVSRRRLYMQTFTAKNYIVDTYVEIYNDFTLVYKCYCQESGEMEPDLDAIMRTMYFSKHAYDGVEASGLYLEDSAHNLAIAVPALDATVNPECPVGVYCSYPQGNIGAFYLNSDPIGSCVYDAEDLLSSFMLYDGMLASLILVDNAQVGNYYDSSFNGTPEIDAEYTCTANGASGVGYARIINGPDIGCYLVFYTLFDANNAEAKDAFAKAIETFEVKGAPQERTFTTYQAPFGVRFAVPADAYVNITDTNETTTAIYTSDTEGVLVGAETDLQGDLDTYINKIITSYNQAENHTHVESSYDKSRFQSKMVKGSFVTNGTTYYYCYAVTILGDNKPYACTYTTTNPATSQLDAIVDYLLWSMNIKG